MQRLILLVMVIGLSMALGGADSAISQNAGQAKKGQATQTSKAGKKGNESLSTYQLANAKLWALSKGSPLAFATAIFQSDTQKWVIQVFHLDGKGKIISIKPFKAIYANQDFKSVPFVPAALAINANGARVATLDTHGVIHLFSVAPQESQTDVPDPVPTSGAARNEQNSQREVYLTINKETKQQRPDLDVIDSCALSFVSDNDVSEKLIVYWSKGGDDGNSKSKYAIITLDGSGQNGSGQNGSDQISGPYDMHAPVVACASSGDRIAVADNDGNISIENIDLTKISSVAQGVGHIKSLAVVYQDNVRRIAALCNDGAVKVWNSNGSGWQENQAPFPMDPRSRAVAILDQQNVAPWVLLANGTMKPASDAGPVTPSELAAKWTALARQFVPLSEAVKDATNRLNAFDQTRSIVAGFHDPSNSIGGAKKLQALDALLKKLPEASGNAVNPAIASTLKVPVDHLNALFNALLGQIRSDGINPDQLLVGASNKPQGDVGAIDSATKHVNAVVNDPAPDSFNNTYEKIKELCPDHLLENVQAIRDATITFDSQSQNVAQGQPFSFPGDKVNKVAFDPAGHVIAVGKQGQLHWEGQPGGVGGQGTETRALASNDRWLVWGNHNGDLYVRSIEPGTNTSPPPAHSPMGSIIESVAFDPHHPSRFVSGLYNRNDPTNKGEVDLWEVQQNQTAQLYSLPFKIRVNAVAYSPDGTSLAVGLHNGDIWVYKVLQGGAIDANHHQELKSLEDEVIYQLVFKDNATLFSFESQNLLRWNLARNQTSPDQWPMGDDLLSIAFTKETNTGGLLAVGCKSGRILVMAVNNLGEPGHNAPPYLTLKAAAQQPEEAQVLGLDFSHDGLKLASGNYAAENNVLVWDVKSWFMLTRKP
jgi:WD40 repeat protein